MPAFDPDAIRRILVKAQVELAEGLDDRELNQTGERFGFRFGADHQEFLRVALPIGPEWPDWRHGSEEKLRQRLTWPLDGVLFDVEHNAFWPRSWGTRPEDPAEMVAEAARHLSEVPRLVPVYSHRYLPAAVTETGYPVFSVYQTDTIYYGSDLLDYLEREFDPTARERPVGAVRRRLPFWSDLVDRSAGEL